MKRLLLIVSFIAALPGASVAQTQIPRAATQGFSVVLLLGDAQSGAAPEGLPDAARKALADMKDFLPYKSYRVLDNQWITADDGSRLTSRLRGMNGQELQLQLQMRVAPRPNGLDVTLQLGDGQGSSAESLAAAEQLGQARARIEAAERNLAAAHERFSDNHPTIQSLAEKAATARAQVFEAQRGVESAKTSSSPLIETNFSMTLGETVVVGTSRVQGDKALIALLTAVPRGAAPSSAVVSTRSVYVIGMIKNPGRWAYEDGMTVQHLIALAGGVAERAADRVEIRRVMNGAQTSIEATLATSLLPNDTVSIPRR